MGNFKQAAQDSLTLSRLHKGREKISTADVTKHESLTVEDFDMVYQSNGTQYPVFTFAELPGKYYQTGIVGTKLVMAWAEMYNDDVDAAAAAYQKEKDKVKLRFKEGKCVTDQTKNVTTIEILD